MTRFLITLQNEKVRQYDRLALFVILLNIAVLTLFASYSIRKADQIAAFTGALAALLSLVIDGYLRKAGRSTARSKYIGSALIVITWIFVGNVWGAILSAVLMFLYQVSQRKLEVGVDREFISYPSFPKRTIHWKELNNLVLKDGLLTIDFKNNKILQSEITNSPVELNEKEFNDFCREQLR